MTPRVPLCKGIQYIPLSEVCRWEPEDWVKTLAPGNPRKLTVCYGLYGKTDFPVLNITSEYNRGRIFHYRISHCYDKGEISHVEVFSERLRIIFHGDHTSCKIKYDRYLYNDLTLLAFPEYFASYGDGLFTVIASNPRILPMLNGSITYFGCPLQTGTSPVPIRYPKRAENPRRGALLVYDNRGIPYVLETLQDLEFVRTL